MYCEMFTTVGLVNTSHNYHFVVVVATVRTLKLCCHSDFQVHIIVLLAIVPVRYIAFLK